LAGIKPEAPYVDPAILTWLSKVADLVTRARPPVLRECEKQGEGHPDLWWLKDETRAALNVLRKPSEYLERLLRGIIMDYEDARLLTDDIKAAYASQIEQTEKVWELLQRAHEQEAWKALKHTSWAAYVQAEFGMEVRYAYRLLDLANVVQAFGEVWPMGHTAEKRKVESQASEISTVINEHQARRINPYLEDAKATCKLLVEEKGYTPEEVSYANCLLLVWCSLGV